MIGLQRTSIRPLPTAYTQTQMRIPTNGLLNSAGTNAKPASPNAALGTKEVRDQLHDIENSRNQCQTCYGDSILTMKSNEQQRSEICHDGLCYKTKIASKFCFFVVFYLIHLVVSLSLSSILLVYCFCTLSGVYFIPVCKVMKKLHRKQIFTPVGTKVQR